MRSSLPIVRTSLVLYLLLLTVTLPVRGYLGRLRTTTCSCVCCTTANCPPGNSTTNLIDNTDEDCTEALCRGRFTAQCPSSGTVNATEILEDPSSSRDGPRYSNFYAVSIL